MQEIIDALSKENRVLRNRLQIAEYDLAVLREELGAVDEERLDREMCLADINAKYEKMKERVEFANWEGK